MPGRAARQRPIVKRSTRRRGRVGALDRRRVIRRLGARGGDGEVTEPVHQRRAVLVPGAVADRAGGVGVRERDSPIVDVGRAARRGADAHGRGHRHRHRIGRRGSIVGGHDVRDGHREVLGLGAGWRDLLAREVDGRDQRGDVGRGGHRHGDRLSLDHGGDVGREAVIVGSRERERLDAMRGRRASMGGGRRAACARAGAGVCGPGAAIVTGRGVARAVRNRSGVGATGERRECEDGAGKPRSPRVEGPLEDHALLLDGGTRAGRRGTCRRSREQIGARRRQGRAKSRGSARLSRTMRSCASRSA